MPSVISRHTTALLPFRILSHALVLVVCCASLSRAHPGGDGRLPQDEVFYHIFTRSFCDSDGDAIGDFGGIVRSLDYLQRLGVTTIWISPVAASRCYHNYFADDFDTIDEEFGGREGLITLAREVHRRGMKILLDMETQYITDRHRWFLRSSMQQEAPEAAYIWYNGPGNTLPEPGPWGLEYLPMYNGDSVRMISLDLHSPQLLEYSRKLYRTFLDPSGNGTRDGGVDGFRLDHVMDDLDGKGVKTGLYGRFWRPLFEDIRRAHPAAFLLVEQADWGYGADVIRATGADGVFAFPLAQAMRSLRPDSILGEVRRTLELTPAGGHQVLILENHDTDRLATGTPGDSCRLRTAAALLLTLPGVPCLYYGQEIGMRGARHEWGSDGNDIPRREAFEWYSSVRGPGMALWYAHTGPWWDTTNLREHDGVSLEEQERDSSSLWHYYRKLIALRHDTPALRRGDFTRVGVENRAVLAFTRQVVGETARGRVLVMVNCGAARETVRLAPTPGEELRVLFDGGLRPGPAVSDARTVLLAPYACVVFEVR